MTVKLVAQLPAQQGPDPLMIVSTTNNTMQPSPNQQDLEGLVENYAWHIIDGLDHKSADQMLFDLLTREYEKMTWDEVTEEIVDLYDEDTLIDLLPDAQ